MSEEWNGSAMDKERFKVWEGLYGILGVHDRAGYSDLVNIFWKGKEHWAPGEYEHRAEQIVNLAADVLDED